MKQIFTSLLAMLCVVSASAVTVTYNGKAIENGSTLTVGADAFTYVEKIPGKKYSFDAKSEILVTDAFELSLKATSQTDKITICQLPADGGQCFMFSKPDNAADSDPYEINIPSFANGVMVDLSLSANTNVIPQERYETEITITAEDGVVKFTFVYDTTAGAGVSEILTDEAGIYTVYTITGIKVLETVDKAEINTLPAGIYVVNGQKVAVK